MWSTNVRLSTGNNTYERLGALGRRCPRCRLAGAFDRLFFWRRHRRWRSGTWPSWRVSNNSNTFFIDRKERTLSILLLLLFILPFLTSEFELTIDLKASFGYHSELVSVAQQACRVINITPPIKFISTNDILWDVSSLIAGSMCEHIIAGLTKINKIYIYMCIFLNTKSRKHSRQSRQ